MELKIRFSGKNRKDFLGKDMRVFLEVEDEELKIGLEAPPIEEEIKRTEKENTSVEKQEKELKIDRGGRRLKNNSNTELQLITDLDLNGTSYNMSLKKFVEEKNPTSNLQRTTVFIYYLQMALGLKQITMNHIYTCYKAMDFECPNNLKQNLNDTCSSRYGYVSRKNGNYAITAIGKTFIENDLPKDK